MKTINIQITRNDPSFNPAVDIDRAHLRELMAKETLTEPEYDQYGLYCASIARIILARKGWRDQIKEEWVKILIGALLIMFLPALMGLADSIGSLILLIGGWVVIGLSVILFAISLITFILAAKKAAKDAPVETTAEEK